MGFLGRFGSILKFLKIVKTPTKKKATKNKFIQFNFFFFSQNCHLAQTVNLTECVPYYLYAKRRCVFAEMTII